MEENQSYETWDIKKIFAGVILLSILGLSFKVLVLDKKSTDNFINKPESVQGASTKETPAPSPISTSDIKRNIENRLNDLKKEVNNINIVEVATSTPAVQKVINDLKNLQSLPQSEAKNACLKICNGL